MRCKKFCEGTKGKLAILLVTTSNKLQLTHKVTFGKLKCRFNICHPQKFLR